MERGGAAPRVVAGRVGVGRGVELEAVGAAGDQIPGPGVPHDVRRLLVTGLGDQDAAVVAAAEREIRPRRHAVVRSPGHSDHVVLSGATKTGAEGTGLCGFELLYDLMTFDFKTY